MKKQFILLSLVGAIFILFDGCTKSHGCNPNPPSTESSAILAYAAANSMTVTQDPSGLYFQVIDPGTGVRATDNSKIFVTYTGKLLDGTVFDHQDVVNTTGFTLSGFIQGWRIGIPLIQKGGHIKLIVPSALAYGCEPYRGLPGSSILYFDVNLVDVQ